MGVEGGPWRGKGSQIGYGNSRFEAGIGGGEWSLSDSGVKHRGKRMLSRGPGNLMWGGGGREAGKGPEVRLVRCVR